MITQLYLSRFNTNGTEHLESFGDSFTGLGVRCSLPGWLQKLEFTIAAKSEADALHRWREHHGDWIVLSDHRGRVLANAWVLDVQRQPGSLRVKYICKGSWERYDAEFYNSEDTEIDPADDIETTIQNLVQTISVAYYDAANIEANTEEVGEFHIADVEDGPGFLPGEAIRELLDFRDASGNQWDFWSEPRWMKSGLPLLEAAKYVQRPTSGTPDFTVDLNDITTSEMWSAHIYDLATTISILPGHLTGTATQTGTDPYLNLQDNTVNFAEYNVQDGDVIVNLTETSSQGERIWCHVAGVTWNDGGSFWELGTRLNNGTSWDSGDDYDIKLQAPKKPATASSTTADYWTVEVVISAPELDQTAAANLAVALKNELSVPVLQQPFVIGGPYIRNASGAKIPIFELLRKPYFVRISGMDDARAALSYSAANRYGMFVTAVDYEHDTRTLRVTPNRPTDRLDALLKNAGITRGEAVESGGRGGDETSDYPWWLDRRAHYLKWKQEGGWDPDWIGDPKEAPDNWEPTV